MLFSQQFAYFFVVKRVKCSVISVLTSKKTQLPRSSRLTIHLSVNFAVRLTSSAQYRKFFQIWSTIADYVNYAWDFSQSETEKYFEWIIKIIHHANRGGCSYGRGYSLWDLHSSLYHPKTDFNKCLIFIKNVCKFLTSLPPRRGRKTFFKTFASFSV